VTAKVIQNEIEGASRQSYSTKTIRTILKKDLNYSYRKIQEGEPYHNTRVNILLRQKFAALLIKHLHEHGEYLHADESPLPNDLGPSYSWQKKKTCKKFSHRRKMTNQTLISAVSSSGHAWSLILEGTNDNLTWQVALIMIFEAIDA
jgi:hypothetical protein